LITLPTYMPLREWADRLVFDLDAYGTFMRLDDEKDWVRWASQFVNNAALVGKVPLPQHFANWKDWAERLCGELL
jgi:hypothetical protein